MFQNNLGGTLISTDNQSEGSQSGANTTNRHEWEERYGIAYPSDRQAWIRVATRAGVPAEFLLGGGWTPEDLLPIIEGYLERELDRPVTPTSPSPASLQDQFVFAPDGDGFLVAGFGERGHFRKLKGYENLQSILQAAGEPVPIFRLLGIQRDPAILIDRRRNSRYSADERIRLRTTSRHYRFRSVMSPARQRSVSIPIVTPGSRPGTKRRFVRSSPGSTR